MAHESDFSTYIRDRAARAKPATLPAWRYDVDGDQIEFVFERTASVAERVNEFWTVFRARSDQRIVGAMIKRVKNFIFRHVPNIVLVYQNGRIRIDYLLLLQAQQEKWKPDSVEAIVYETLLEKTANVQVEAQLEAATAT